MRIAIVGPSYPWKGGISHYNTSLCKALSKKHDVKLFNYGRRYPDFIHPGGSQLDPSKERLYFKGDKIIDMVNPFTWIKTAFKIKKYNPKILILYWYSPIPSPLLTTIAFLVKNPKTKIIIFCLNVIPPEKRLFDRILEKLFLRYGDVFIAASKYDYKLIRKKYPRHRIFVNPHPNYNFLNYGKFTRKTARETLKVGDCILIFGYMRKYKGLEYLLRAMPYVLKEKKVTLLVVGEFWGDIEKYKKLIQQLRISDNVRLIEKYVKNEEVEIFFKASDLLVAPYTSHTNSGVIATSFSFGIPVLAADVGSFREVIGSKGMIVKRNPKDIANAIISFYRQKKTFNMKSERFTWEHLVKTIENTKIYQED